MTAVTDMEPYRPELPAVAQAMPGSQEDHVFQNIGSVVRVIRIVAGVAIGAVGISPLKDAQKPKR